MHFIRHIKTKFNIFYNKDGKSYRYYRLGLDLEKNNRWTEAAAAYQSAVDLNDQKAEWYYRLGFVLEKTNNWRKAAAAYQAAIKLNNLKANWHYRLGIVLEKINKLPEATNAYESALKINSEEAFYNYRFGLMVSKRPNQLTEAVKYLSRAVELRPEPTWIAELKYFKTSLDAGANFISSKSKPSQWYDEVYKHSDEYRKHFHESNYWSIWSRIIDFINKYNNKNILEIGCGSGQLALAVKSLTSTNDYVGIDFSAQAISMARIHIPEYNFIIGDVLVHEIVQDPSFDLVICTEVLEHLDEDLFLLSRINRDTKILATVPDYDSASHVRYFNETDDVAKRYSKHICNIEIDPIKYKENIIFLIKGKIC